MVHKAWKNAVIMDKYLNYYNNNAEDFVENAFSVDMTSIYDDLSQILEW